MRDRGASLQWCGLNHAGDGGPPIGGRPDQVAIRASERQNIQQCLHTARLQRCRLRRPITIAAEYRVIVEFQDPDHCLCDYPAAHRPEALTLLECAGGCLLTGLACLKQDIQPERRACVQRTFVPRILGEFLRRRRDAPNFRLGTLTPSYRDADCSF